MLVPMGRLRKHIETIDLKHAAGSHAMVTSVVTIIIFFVSMMAFTQLPNAPRSFSLTLMLVAFIATLVLHEFIHGLGFASFGARPVFGAGIAAYSVPYLYTISPKSILSRRRMLAVGLAPLVTISVLSILAAIMVPASIPYAAIIFATNLTGAVADMRVAFAITKVRDSARRGYRAELDGMHIFSRP